MVQSFDFILARNIAKSTSIDEVRFLEAYHIYKKYDNIDKSEFATPPL